MTTMTPSSSVWGWARRVPTDGHEGHASVCRDAPPLASSPVCSYLFLLGHLLLWFGDDLLLLRQDHLDVAGGAHVGVDAAVGAVGAPPHLGGLVDLDVLDHQRVHVQTLKAHPTGNTWTSRLLQQIYRAPPHLSRFTAHMKTWPPSSCCQSGFRFI